MSRGYREDGMAPNASMWINDELTDRVTLAELLELMVARREKIIRDTAVVGRDVAKRSYDDVVAAVEAIKSAIEDVSRQ